MNLFPQIQNNSMIAAAGILAIAIEIIGFVRGRSDKDQSASGRGEKTSGAGQEGVRLETQTNTAGNVNGPVLSGQFEGPVQVGDRITQNIQPHEKPPVPSQIPAPPKDFTGRSKEIDELLTGFEKGATITGLQGTGGIGKTALALVVAERLKAGFPDGQIFINLRGTSKNPMDPASAMAHVIRTYLGPDARLPEVEGELAGLYHSVLSGRKALLLLDNAASREQVEPLLPPLGCAVIVTSRNRFALPGLKAKELDVLPLEDAKKLLLEIADRIGGQAEELARLCGCLPIALRNAASVLAERHDLGVAEYLERLQEARNRVELVEASFSLSYDLLSPELQRLWSMLSVFPADFDREGATAVWALDPDSAAGSLSDLVKWSLVEFDPAMERYHLHDLARDYAASRLPDGEKAEAEERHAEYYRGVLSDSDEQYMKGGGEPPGRPGSL